MAITDYQGLLSIAGAITIIGTSYLTLRKIARDAAKAKKEQAAEILQAAKEEDAALKLKLTSKINELESQLEVLEKNIEKDMKYMKESYGAEIKNLGEKIENLRTDLSAQHGSLLALLTKLVDK